MAALDYACFPHIFTTVMENCDRETQIGLRLLCSATKREVDRFDCRHLSFDNAWFPNGIFISARAPIRRSPFIRVYSEVRDKTGSVPEESRDFAVGSAHSIVAWAEEVEAICLSDIHGREWEASKNEVAESSPLLNPPLALSHLKPSCRLELLHMYGHDGADSITHSIRLPTIHELNITFVGDRYECRCSPLAKLVHTCTRLKIKIEDYRDRICPLGVAALTPIVQELTLIVAGPPCAAAYFEDVKEKERNPNLLVKVVCRFLSEAEISSLKEGWSRVLGVPVRVEEKRW